MKVKIIKECNIGIPKLRYPPKVGDEFDAYFIKENFGQSGYVINMGLLDLFVLAEYCEVTEE
jgi:hypothetical protein